MVVACLKSKSNDKISADTPTYKWKKYSFSVKNRKEQNRMFQLRYVSLCIWCFSETSLKIVFKNCEVYAVCTKWKVTVYMTLTWQ